MLDKETGEAPSTNLRGNAEGVGVGLGDGVGDGVGLGVPAGGGLESGGALPSSPPQADNIKEIADNAAR